MVFHSLQQRLDRLGAVVVADQIRWRQCICLVDEEDTSDRVLHSLVGFGCSMADVLADEPGPVDLDQVAALEQPHRPVGLGEESGNGRLARAGVSVKDEVLTDGHVGEAVFAAPALHFEEGKKGGDLFLDGRQSNEGIELGAYFR